MVKTYAKFVGVKQGALWSMCKCVNLCVRLDRCCVELHQGTVSKMLSLILLAITRLRRNWVKIRPSNSPTMQ